jgi:hypothetical protein
MNLERLEVARATPVWGAAPVLLAVGTALPPNVVDQQSLAALLRSFVERGVRWFAALAGDLRPSSSYSTDRPPLPRSACQRVRRARLVR